MGNALFKKIFFDFLSLKAHIVCLQWRIQGGD